MESTGPVFAPIYRGTGLQKSETPEIGESALLSARPVASRSLAEFIPNSRFLTQFIPSEENSRFLAVLGMTSEGFEMTK